MTVTDLVSYEDALASYDPVMADDRLYRVAGALEQALDDRRGHPLLEEAPAL